MYYTIVTVVHKTDLPFLQLQARSFSQYLDISLIKEIIVVDNTMGEDLPSSQFLSQYGGKVPVRILKASTMATMPLDVRGWVSQQIYKLLVAKYVTTKRYIILDAKTHLIKNFDISSYETKNGRIRICGHGYDNHPLKSHLLKCCKYMNVDPEMVIHKFLPTTPPFIMVTDIVLRMIKFVEQQENQSFVKTFLEKDFTEFFLYGIYLYSRGYYNLYEIDYSCGVDSIWEETSNKSMQQTFTKPSSVFLAVHRRAFRNMHYDTRIMLAQFWYNKRLFASYDDALNFVKGWGHKA